MRAPPIPRFASRLTDHAMTNDPPPRKPARKANVTRGMFRAWVLFSALWVVSFLGLSAPTWYHAASYWIHTYGFHVVEEFNAKAQASAVLCNRADDNNILVNRCFNVTSPGGCKYFVAADRRVYTSPYMVAAYIVEYADTQRCDKPTTGGFGHDPIVVDLTSSRPAGGGWVVVPALGTYPDLSDAKILTILAFAVPAGLLALGAALGWVATGFKP